MTPDTLLKALLPFIPAGKRTAVGVALFVVGAILAAITTPDIIELLPERYHALAAVLQAWGAAGAALGIRAAKATD